MIQKDVKKEAKTQNRKMLLIKALAVAGALVIISAALNFIFPLPLQRLNMDYSVIHMASNGELLRISLSPGGKYRIKVPLNDMSMYLRKGFLEFEDRHYYLHPGINPLSVLRAVVLNLQGGKVVSGASTIPMQTAKIAEPKKRNLWSKLIESFRALQLEAHYSKDELYELYLNTIPMGGNIEGVGAASYLYFNKPPSELTPGEAAILIALPKSTNKFRPDRHPGAAAEARYNVLRRVAAAMGLKGQSLENALCENIPVSRFKNPYKLQHLVSRRLITSGFVRKYTVNMQYQAMAEYMLKNTLRRLKKYGVYNGAILIVENETMKVLSYVGSPDFYDGEHCGQIDGVNIIRSPGSVLKPFIYSLAVENGILTPKKAVYDTGKTYEGYTPENFEKIYHGVIPAEEALTHSYNLPAVGLEYELGKKGLHTMLLKAGFTDRGRGRVNPGLSVALGAYPVTLEELTILYAAFANGGKAKPLLYDAGITLKPEQGIELFSRETAYITTHMLANGERPDLPQSWEFTNYRGRVAFKTGTSFGLRDAWCVGYNPKYTVGIWLGNADAKPSFELIGIKAAAPLLIEIFNFLTRFTDDWFEKPEKVAFRKVCAVSGDVPGEYCKKTVEDRFIEGVTINTRCEVHKLIYVKKSNGKRADPAFIKESPDKYKKIIVEDWPVEVASFLRKSGRHLPAIPPYDPAEAPAGTYLKPKILSPAHDNTYYITKDMPVSFQKIKLKGAVAGSGRGNVKWFLNGSVIKSCGADEEVFIEPKPGEWTITLQDETGLYDKVSFEVVENK